MAKRQNPRNPDNNSIVQALIDLADRGMSTWKIGDLLTRLSSDPKLRKDLQAVWNSHAYPESAMVYAQLGIDQRLFTLSDKAYKIITLLGLYCHQSGLIQARIEDIMHTTGIKRTPAKQALAELRECGAITIAVPSVRHEAPVYRVNPALINKGRRRQSDERDFTASLEIPAGDYLFSREPDLTVKTDVIHKDDITYNHLYLVSAEQAKEAKSKRSRKKSSKGDDSIPGQMSLFDFTNEVFPHDA